MNADSKVKLSFIDCCEFICSAFYLCRATSAILSATLSYTHAQAEGRRGLYTVKSVPCNKSLSFILTFYILDFRMTSWLLIVITAALTETASLL